MSEDDEPDFFGRTGEKSQCHCCEGRGLYWNETCFVCAGYGWVREDEPMTNTDAKIMREEGSDTTACGWNGKGLCECDQCEAAFKRHIARKVRAYFRKDTPS